MDITAIGTAGTLHLNDFIVPFGEKEASFTTSSKSEFTDLVTAWVPAPSRHTVTTDLPQEACMVTEFARLVGNIKANGAKPDPKWPTISRKTQLILDAVKTSISEGLKPVEIAAQKKHEKAVGLDVGKFDKILEAGRRLMKCELWMGRANVET
ncbi:unnamed protein product [Dovyalis caffra]|uniref:Uncharacterized protein n=1 Tax=Dovyalis caffra TaxID=77055 RepID=A0AAV1S719_9ROSI|nr:unnamed protein product [Dovyalis caffra]